MSQIIHPYISRKNFLRRSYVKDIKISLKKKKKKRIAEDLKILPKKIKIKSVKNKGHLFIRNIADSSSQLF